MNGSPNRLAMVSRLAFVFGLALLPVLAQDPPAQPADQTAPAAEQQTLAPEQLESLVAPIALYPDSLLSQVLVASTYPLELVEANQWLVTNGSLRDTALTDAAKQQSWDPSIQALVPFQDVIKRLTSDIRWTTDLGNAFLAQQADVMAAVQRLRAKAKDSGKLTDTPQQKISVENQDGQSAIVIQPADPQIVYVPTYNPAYFWGAPPYGYGWPGLYYPGVGLGWGWGSGLNLGFYFGGCCGWGGWGWGPRWFGGGGIYVNNSFFHRYSYAEFHGGAGFRGNAAWAHNPEHRGAVPYGNRAVANRFQGAANNARAQSRPNPSSFSRGNERAPSGGTNNHSAFGGVSNGSKARQQSDHGFSSVGQQRAAPSFHPSGGGSARPSGGGGARPAGGGGGGRGRGR